MKLLYFAWIRQRVGIGEEDREIPASLVTIAELMAWLSRQGENYASAFAEPERVRAAKDQEHVPLDTPIAGAAEIAFFPPVTGG